MNQDTFINKFFAKTASLLPFSSLKNKNLIIPFYHTVSDNELRHIKHLYRYKNEQEFKKDLDFFLDHYTPVSLHEILDDLKGVKELPKNAFHITFDDGLHELYTVIAPILKEKKIPATVFLNSAFIDNKDLFYRYKASILIDELEDINNSKKLKEVTGFLDKINIVKKTLKQRILSVNYQQKEILENVAEIIGINFSEYLQTNKIYLSTSEINKMISEGFTFGAHSIDHPQYNNISEKEQLRQTKESLDYITSVFNLDYKVFAFPFTDIGVRKSFFEQISPYIDASFGSSGVKKDFSVKHYHRIEMEDTSLSARQVLSLVYLKNVIQKMMGKNIVKRN